MAEFGITLGFVITASSYEAAGEVAAKIRDDAVKAGDASFGNIVEVELISGEAADE